jgi:alanine racemase
MIEVARRLEAESIDFLGVADIAEALALRAAGVGTPILAWLHAPGETFETAIEADVDLGVATTEQLESIASAAAELGKTARVHLKVDTGLSRNGAHLRDWPELVAVAHELALLGRIKVVALFSHLSSTSTEDDLAQIQRFNGAVELAKAACLHFEMRHLVASDGALNYAQAHFEMVRIGVALYGLSPFTDHSSGDYGLVPAMTAKSFVVQVKRAEAGEGVSYGYLHRTVESTNLALVPVGYAEGLPRSASGKAQVQVAGQPHTIQSRIAMDQFVIDVGQQNVQIGDEVVLFGDPSKGQISVDALAQATDTINYEIVTRMGGRFVREFFGSATPGGAHELPGPGVAF